VRFPFILKLVYIRIFALIFASYNTILTPLNTRLKLTIVTSLLAVKKTPEPPSGVHSTPPTFSDNINPFRERITVQATVTVLETFEKFANLGWLKPGEEEES
jgi:hypothetical protein